jgi:hypothetical protein
MTEAVLATHGSLTASPKSTRASGAPKHEPASGSGSRNTRRSAFVAASWTWTTPSKGYAIAISSPTTATKGVVLHG